MDHEKLLEQARKRFRTCVDAEHSIREEAYKDLDFLAGDQWPAEVKAERDTNRRPALTINRLPTYVQQVVNDTRKNKPSITISPIDSGIDKDTAEVMQGLVRHIEVDSGASVAYVTAHEYQVSCGMGVWRITTEYVDDETVDQQEIKIRAVQDPFSVYFDALAKEVDRSDARYAFVVGDRMGKEEFKLRYPDAETTTHDLFEGESERYDGWIDKESVRVAEYWYVELKNRIRVALNTGETAWKDEIPEGAVPTGPEREVVTRQVRCAKINGAEVLEENDWAGQWIPLIAVYGKELITRDGKRHIFSLIRFARDPQQLLNFYKSAQAEVVGLAPKAPFIGVEGQFEGHEEKWRTSNIATYAYLEYKNISVGGQLVGPPQRNTYEPPIQGLTAGSLQSADDIKATMGIFDAALGARSNETSGIAIQRRQKEADNANFHFTDNLSRAQQFCGKQLIDLIPRIYDTAREIRIVGEDDTKRVVTVNELYNDPQTGRLRQHDLTAGKYDVAVSTGPTYQSKREESFTAWTEFAKAYPPLLQIAGDLVFRNSDLPGADQVADRFKKALPPGLAADDKDQTPIPPQALAQMQQQAQQIELLTAELTAATTELKTKQPELASRERIATMETQAAVIIAEAKLGSAEALELIKHEIGMLGQRFDALVAQQQTALEAQHQAGLQQQQGDIAAQQQAAAAAQQTGPTGGPSKSPGSKNP